ncbi:MAG: caspase family protein [Rhizobiaceae bacterium]|nr:caspase family protein [Rhizobiaceae bacterium]
MFPALLAHSPAAAQDGTVDFHLDLDTGGHRAAIRDIAVSADGELIVSASDDKTIRLWDWRSGRTIRTIRGQIGPGNEGKVFAVAISPDGDTIAAAGFFGQGFGDRPPYGDIRLFDTATGRLKAVLKGHEYAVYDLDFSPDGALLAAGDGDGLAFVWERSDAETSGWRLRAQLDANSWQIHRVRFALGGSRLIAATTDNGMRLWNMASGEEIETPDAETLRDQPLTDLTVSADGTVFATASQDGAVRVWSAADGALVAALPTLGFQIGSLTFAGNTMLAISCGYNCADRNRSVVWSLDSQTFVSEFRGHDNSVTAGAGMPDGATVVTAGGTANTIRLWDAASGLERTALSGTGRPVFSVAIDSGAGRIAWGTENACPDAVSCPEALGELTMTMRLPNPDRSFENPENGVVDGAGLRRSVHQAGDFLLRAGPGGDYGLEDALLELIRSGETVETIENDETNGYNHTAFTLLASAEEFVTGGSDGTMIAYSTDSGAFAGEFLGGHSGHVLAVAEAPAAQRLLTGSSDQTMRLWNLDSRELIVSMFFAGSDWIVWTPQGYFNSSPNGDRLVGWHVNQGQDSEARFVRARQLRQHLHSPEIVRRAIILGDASQAARELRGTDGQLHELLQRKPPEFEIRLAEDVPAGDGFVAVEIIGADDAEALASRFTVLANDRRIDEYASRSVGGDGQSNRLIIEVPVEDGQNEILVSGLNEFGYVTERGVTALARRSAADENKGKLYVAVIGVEEYPFLPTDCNGRSCDLAYPVDDAAEILRVIADKTAPLYSGMESLVLVNRDALDEDADRRAAVEALLGGSEVLDPEADTIGDELVDFLDLPGPEDTTIIFVAGHGINIEEDYYFIPTDGRKRDENDWRRSSLVEWSDIQRAVERAKGRRIMLLDTCHAANAFNPRLEKEAADARVIVFSATAANNTAGELAELGHGIFTYSVLQGLRGEARTGDDGVRLLGLADYIYREVVRLSGSKQEPFYHISQTSNFLLARP